MALVPIAFPFLHDSFPLTHDSGTHVAYVHRFDRALHQGQFPVRWVETAAPGQGHALFNYYQVGFYYLVAALHEVLPGLLSSLKAAIVLLWWSGAAFMFLLCRRFGTAAAATAAGVFALSPYVITDGLVRGAYPELAAIVFAAAALWRLDRFLLQGSGRRLATLALAFSAMALSHLAASLVLSALFAAHMSWLWIARRTTGRRLAGAAGAGVLALGLTAFYTGPALVERDLVEFDRFTHGHLDYRRHFVPAAQLVRHAADYQWSYGGSMTDATSRLPVHVSLLEWLVIGSAVVILTIGAARGRPFREASGLAVWLGLIAVAFFMMSSSSAWIWERVPALALLQFPWKFFMLLSFAGSLVAALLVSAIPRRGLQALALVGIVGLQVHFHARHLHPEAYGDLQLYDIDRPDWREDPAVQDWDFREHALAPAGASGETDVWTRWSVADGDALVAERAMLDHRMRLLVDTPTGVTVTLHTPYFPGWVVRLDDTPVPVRPRPGDLYMEVMVPAGVHGIEAVFEDTPVRAWSNRISLVSALVVTGLAVGQVPVRRRRRP